MNPFFDTDLDTWLDNYNPHNKLWAWFIGKCSEIEGYKEEEAEKPAASLSEKMVRTASGQGQKVRVFDAKKAKEDGTATPRHHDDVEKIGGRIPSGG